MKSVVFISDLHLDAIRPDINKRFNFFLDWAQERAEEIYILGDLFHVWSGDDCADTYALDIADKLHALAQRGIALYFLPGNRDFLLSQAFAKRCGMLIINEPYTIILGDTKVCLAHGDRYCLKDRRHQWFRWFTRNAWFTSIFLRLPQNTRKKLTRAVRKQSGEYQKHHIVNTSIDPNAVSRDMVRMQASVLIHGHIHRPGIHSVPRLGDRYVLSDWDDTPSILCYDETIGYNFVQI